jgi:hypothetical protein
VGSEENSSEPTLAHCDYYFVTLIAGFEAAAAT